VLENTAGGGHLVVLLLIALVTIGALVVLWRDRTRRDLVKVLWTVVIVVIPIVGALGFFVNFGLGKLVDRLDRRAA
jgi:ABC-type transport system involved in cytochrome c biogenesis permease subunit